MNKDKDIILEMNGICKQFPGVKALDNVSLKIRKGEIHALVGANGAGKSTLMKILAGIFPQDKGDIYLFGKKVTINNSSHAQRLGISIVFQELNVIPHLSVLENIFLNRESIKTGIFYDWKAMERQVYKIMEELGVEFEPHQKIKDMPIANQQMVEITKAVSAGASIIILDEPTSSLSAKEVEKLFSIMKNLKKKEVAIIFISHRLDEIFRVCDRVTVLRDGKLITTSDIKDTNSEELVKNMIGRDLKEEFPKRQSKIGKEILKVKGLSLAGCFHNISFTLHQGEVLGLGGLVGSGRTELAKAIFGALQYDQGQIFLEEKIIAPRSPQDALRLGIAYVTEDRKVEGLLLSRSVKENVTLSSLKKILSYGFINKKLEKASVDEMINSLLIKTSGSEQKVINLSGGNQQKVSLAKWLLTKPKVIILDEPTRGIDVGAKAEFYALINKLAEEGAGIILISSEQAELIGLCDKLVVLREGQISGELIPSDNCEEQLMRYMMGVA